MHDSAVGVLAQGDPGTGSGAPWWLTLVLALIALGGVVLSALLVRRSSKEASAIADNNAILARLDGRLATLQLEKWRRREETMRMLRWAGESAASENNDTLAGVGLAALDALGQSELLQTEDQVFIDKVLDAILDPVVAEYHEMPGEVEVVQHEEGV